MEGELGLREDRLKRSEGEEIEVSMKLVRLELDIWWIKLQFYVFEVELMRIVVEI